MPPSEFWRLSPCEFWWYAEAKNPDLFESPDRERLLKLIEEGF